MTQRQRPRFPLRAAGVGIASVVTVGATILIGACTEETAATSAPEEGGAVLAPPSSPPQTDEGVHDGSAVEAAAGDAGDDAAIPPGLVCGSDAHCLGGKCYEGVCICNPLLHLQPSGKCGGFPEPGCLPQEEAGARCQQVRPVCKEDAGEITGSNETNRSCGDFVPSTCCFAGCRGPTFVCCGPTGARPQICVQGWRTCNAGERAVPTEADCR